MSTWGSGNFENDGAHDTLGQIYLSIIDNIKETFKCDNNTTLYDNQGDERIIANIDILCTLAEHYQSGLDLELEEIQQWKQHYLDTFDRVAVSPTPEDLFPDFLSQRRSIVVATFDRFHEIVRSLWED